MGKPRLREGSDLSKITQLVNVMRLYQALGQGLHFLAEISLSAWRSPGSWVWKVLELGER